MTGRSCRSWPRGSSRASAVRTARSARDSPGCLDLPLQYRDLMAQDEDLGVLGLVGPGEHGKPAEHAERR